MTSTFSWLDYDEAQARRAAEFVRSLDEPETLDSLGIGAVRDGIADLLFPGTSTIQTRAKYFLIVPWSVLHVAGRRPHTRLQYDNWLKDTEVQVINSLLAGSAKGETGIIGRISGSKTIRMPSVVYWPALGQWGIRTAPELTRSDYREEVLSRRTRELLENESGDRRLFEVFDEIPEPPAGFPAEPLNLLLTADESDYLLARMQETIAGGLRNARSAALGEPSLLALVAKQPELSAVDSPWQLRDHGIALSELLSTALLHAEMFSLLIQGARLRYVQLLFKGQRQAGLPISAGSDLLAEAVANWTESVTDSRLEAARWVDGIASLFEFMRQNGTAIGSLTEGFVVAWCRMAVSDPVSAMSSMESERLIISRESALKGPNARLSNESPLRAWEGARFGSEPLDYRWGVARRMLFDCQNTIESGEANNVGP